MIDRNPKDEDYEHIYRALAAVSDEKLARDYMHFARIIIPSTMTGVDTSDPERLTLEFNNPFTDEKHSFSIIYTVSDTDLQSFYNHTYVTMVDGEHELTLTVQQSGMYEEVVRQVISNLGYQITQLDKTVHDQFKEKIANHISEVISRQLTATKH